MKRSPQELIEDLILGISMVLAIAALLILLSTFWAFPAKADSSATVTVGLNVVGPIATPTEPEYSDAMAIPTVPDDGSINY